MFSVLRNRFGIPGVIAVIALVFAMLGGAYAATDSGNGSKLAEASKRKHKKKKESGLNKKQKKQVQNIAKSFQGTGPTGPVGPQGPKGDAGANGLNGQKGATGTTGADGVGTKGDSVVLLDEAPAGCEAGGYTYGIEGTDEENEVCNGVDGETGFTATLPPGATETGGFGGTVSSEDVGADVNINYVSSISFSIPLAERLPEAQTKGIPTGGLVPAECEDSTHEGLASVTNPEAAPGYLCVYSGTGAETVIDEEHDVTTKIGQSFVPAALNLDEPKIGPGLSPFGASTAGALIVAIGGAGSAPGSHVGGTFAVTGCDSAQGATEFPCP